MSRSPTTGIARLSLEDMHPSPRSPEQKTRMSSSEGKRAQHEGPGDADDSMDEDNSSTVQSPTKLKYNIEKLSPRSRKLVRSLWGESFEEPPEISLQWCDRKLDADGNVDFYAFQMHEVVPRSVRIGSPKSQYSEPQCQCGASKPCKHLIWLADCIAQQALHDHDPQESLTLSDKGYPDELGEPFQCISDIHLDVLADGLHCVVGHPLARTSPSQQRLEDARNILASIADPDQRFFDSYRSDLTQASFDSSSLVHYEDAEGTLFSLLVASHRLSAWLRSRLRPWDPAQSPFTQIESRAKRIFADLDAYLASTASEAASIRAAAEGPCDIPWASTSLTRCVRQIHNLVARTEAPLHHFERASAARALVRILRGVVDRHTNDHPRSNDTDTSLYARLIGDSNGGFIAETLELLVDQAQFTDEIEDILADVGVRGAAAPWVARMETVVARMRTNRRATAGLARGERKSSTAIASGQDRERHRQGHMQRRRPVSPALGPVEHGAPGSASASGLGVGGSAGVGLGIGYGDGAVGTSSAAKYESVSAAAGSGGSKFRFVAPETPAGPSSSSSRGTGGGGRGSRGGGAGSKRSGSGTGAERGAKRAR